MRPYLRSVLSVSKFVMCVDDRQHIFALAPVTIFKLGMIIARMIIAQVCDACRTARTALKQNQGR